jgi:hypothetical protein
MAASFAEPSGNTIVDSYSLEPGLYGAVIQTSSPLDGAYFSWHEGMVEYWNEYAEDWVPMSLVTYNALYGARLVCQSDYTADFSGIAWRIIPPLSAKTVGGRPLAPLTGTFRPYSAAKAMDDVDHLIAVSAAKFAVDVALTKAKAAG